MGGFKEHYTAGIFSYTIFFSILTLGSLVIAFLYELPRNWNPTIPTTLTSTLLCFCIALLCSLWPDIDIKSKSQQIFYSLFSVFNLILIVRQSYKISAFFGFFAMLPMLGKHRGWTHSRLTMIIFPSFFVFIPLYFESGSRDIFDFWEQIKGLDWRSELSQVLPLYLAGVIGYATHLQVDGILWFRSKKRKQSV